MLGMPKPPYNIGARVQVFTKAGSAFSGYITSIIYKPKTNTFLYRLSENNITITEDEIGWVIDEGLSL